MLTINTNLSSLIAQGNLHQSTNKLNQAIERMTTGYKINHASDNAANYSIATKMDTKIDAYMVAADNVSQGIDMIETASANLSLLEDKLSRLRALQEQAINGTYGQESLEAINSEVNALVDEINRIYSTTEYNGIKVFSSQELNQTAPIATFATLRASTSNSAGFIQQINRRNTAGMKSLSEVNENADLEDGSYSISTPDELVKLSEMTNAGLVSSGDEFVLVNDIDMDGIDWIQIGVGTAFTGTFDGNGFEISNCIDSLFYEIDGGEVKNLGLLTGDCLAGGVINAKISNCYVLDSAIWGGYYNNYYYPDLAAGLINTANNSVVEFCYVKDTLLTADKAGGLVGVFNGGTMSNCYVDGGDRIYNYSPCRVGKLIYDAVGVNVTNCYSTFRDDSYPVNSSVNSIDESPDWDGTPFTLYQATGDSYVPSAVGGGTPAPTPNEGTGGNALTTGIIALQIGVTSYSSSQIGVNTNFVLGGVDDLRMIGLDTTTDYLSKIDDILSLIAEKQTHFGSVQNRLLSVLDEITIQQDNLISSLSTIRDADMAEVSATYIQQQILQQASATLMATANQTPALALQLL